MPRRVDRRDRGAHTGRPPRLAALVALHLSASAVVVATWLWLLFEASFRTSVSLAIGGAVALAVGSYVLLVTRHAARRTQGSVPGESPRQKKLGEFA